MASCAMPIRVCMATRPSSASLIRNSTAAQDTEDEVSGYGVCESEPGKVYPATDKQSQQPRQVEKACQQMHAHRRRGCGKKGLEGIYERRRGRPARHSPHNMQ